MTLTPTPLLLTLGNDALGCIIERLDLESLYNARLVCQRLKTIACNVQSNRIYGKWKEKAGKLVNAMGKPTFVLLRRAELLLEFGAKRRHEVDAVNQRLNREQVCSIAPYRMRDWVDPKSQILGTKTGWVIANNSLVDLSDSPVSACYAYVMEGRTLLFASSARRLYVFERYDHIWNGIYRGRIRAPLIRITEVPDKHSDTIGSKFVGYTRMGQIYKIGCNKKEKWRHRRIQEQSPRMLALVERCFREANPTLGQLLLRARSNIT